MVKRSNGERIQFRVSPSEVRILENIQLSGQFPDKSSTVRFCIEFTKTVLSVIPAAVGESLIAAMEEQNEENNKQQGEGR